MQNLPSNSTQLITEDLGPIKGNIEIIVLGGHAVRGAHRGVEGTCPVQK